MNKKKQKDVESSKSEVLNRHYHEISHELQESIELLSNLTKYIIREIDLNGNAKTITSNLSEIMTKTNNEYSSCLKDLAELSEHLKKENMVLRAQQYKPPAMHDAGVNTDDNEMWSPERHAAHLAREMNELQSRAEVIINKIRKERSALKDRVQQQFDELKAVHERMRVQDCSISAQLVEVEGLELANRRLEALCARLQHTTSNDQNFKHVPPSISAGHESERNYLDDPTELEEHLKHTVRTSASSGNSFSARLSSKQDRENNKMGDGGVQVRRDGDDKYHRDEKKIPPLPVPWEDSERELVDRRITTDTRSSMSVGPTVTRHDSNRQRSEQQTIAKSNDKQVRELPVDSTARNRSSDNNSSHQLSERLSERPPTDISKGHDEQHFDSDSYFQQYPTDRELSSGGLKVSTASDRSTPALRTSKIPRYYDPSRRRDSAAPETVETPASEGRPPISPRKVSTAQQEQEQRLQRIRQMKHAQNHAHHYDDGNNHKEEDEDEDEEMYNEEQQQQEEEEFYRYERVAGRYGEEEEEEDEAFPDRYYDGGEEGSYDQRLFDPAISVDDSADYSVNASFLNDYYERDQY